MAELLRVLSFGKAMDIAAGRTALEEVAARAKRQAPAEIPDLKYQLSSLLSRPPCFQEALDISKFEPPWAIADFQSVLSRLRAFGYDIFQADC
jgi:hypothetical protein